MKGLLFLVPITSSLRNSWIDANKIAQRMKALISKPNDRSLIPRPRVAEDRSSLTSCPLTATQMCASSYTQPLLAPTHTTLVCVQV